MIRDYCNKKRKINQNTKIQKQQLNTLYNASIGEVFGPVKLDDNVFLLIKSEEGMPIKITYEKARNKILKQIKDEKFIIRKKHLVEKLKNIYEIEIDKLQPLADKILKEKKSY